MKPEPVATPPAAPAPPAPVPPVKVTPSALRIRTNVRAGAGDRLFDSQNNANGFWDEDGDE